MKKTLLVQVLYNLTEAELTHFELFLKSPFFKQPLYVYDLYKLLREKYPDCSNLSAEEAFSICRPGEDYDSLKMNNITKGLLGHLESFLAHQKLQEEDILKQQLTIKAYGERDLYSVFKKRSLALNKKLMAVVRGDEQSMLARFQNSMDLYYHPGTEKIEQKNIPTVTYLSEQLDCYYAYMKMKLVLENLSHKRISGKHIPLYLVEEAVEFISGKSEVIFKVYAPMYKLLNSPLSEENYEDAYRIFVEYQELLTKDQLGGFLSILINQITPLNVKNPGKYREVQFNLFVFAIASEAFMINGRMPGQVFLNIVIVAAILKKFDFIEDFMKENNQYLEAESKPDILFVSKCYLYFHQGNFEDADQLFHDFPLQNKRYKLLANSMHFRCLYEMAENNKDNAETFFAYVISFNRYLDRNKPVTAERLKAYKNMVTIAKMMMQTKIMNKSQKTISIRKIKALLKEPVIAKEWLDQKLNLL